jgi:flavin-binding protein dodecin
VESEHAFWVSKVSELIGSSPESFEDAARRVLARANRTLRGITGIDVVEKRVKVEDERIVEYRVRLRLLFAMAPEIEQHW